MYIFFLSIMSEKCGWSSYSNRGVDGGEVHVPVRNWGERAELVFYCQ